VTGSPNRLCQDGVPTRLAAFLIWVSAGLAMIGTGVALLVLALVLSAGSQKQLLGMLQDPTKLPALPTLSDPFWVALGTLCNELTILGALGLWLWLLKASRRAVLPFRRPSVAAVGGGLCLTFGLAPLAEVAGEVMHDWVKNSITASRVVTHAAKSASPGTFALIVVCLALMPALVEEVMFRGVITASFLRRGSRSVAAGILVPSLLFALFHMEPAQVAGTFVLGVGFGVIRVMSDTMPPSMIAHGLYNATVVIVVRDSPAAANVNLGAPVVVLGLVVATLGFGLLWLARRARLGRERGAAQAGT
jgi:membrane protease YdiL (CAAX protease family)